MQFSHKSENPQASHPIFIPYPSPHPPQTLDFGPPWGLPSISQAQNHVTLLFHCRKIAILQGHLAIQKPFTSQVLGHAEAEAEATRGH